MQRLADREQPDGDDHDVDAVLELIDPNDSRDWPVSWSTPTNLISTLIDSEMKPRTSDDYVSAVTDANASSVSAK